MKKLTDKWIKSVKGGKYVTRTADNQVKGLTLAITPAGTKTFWIKYTFDQKKLQHKLGIWPSYSLDQARTAARDFREKLEGGEDPARDAKQLAASKAVLAKAIDQAPRTLETMGADTPLPAKERLQLYRDANINTVDALFTLYEADLLAGGKHTKEMLAAYRLDIEPFIGNTPASEVTSDVIADLLGAIVDRGSVRKADIVRGYLLRAFNLGRKAKYSTLWRSSTPEFNLIANPVEPIEKAGEYNPRNRELSKDEVKLLWHDLGNDFQAPTALAIKLILSTGARVTEILEAKQSEFDLDAGVWSLPMERWKIRRKAQHAQPHLVPLTDFHIELIKQAMALAGDSEYLFPSRDGQPIRYRSLNQAIGRYCNRTGFDHFVTKDMRRTFKTLSGACGLSIEIRNRLQGHAFNDIGSRNYDRYSYWPEKQEAMAKWIRWFDHVVTGELAKVINIKAVS